MKNLLVILIVGLILSSCGMPVVRFTPPQALDRAGYDIEKLLDENIGRSAVCLDRSVITEQSTFNGYVQSTIYSSAYLIIDPKSPNFSSFVINESSSTKVANIFLRVISPENEITQYKKENCRVEKGKNGETVYKLAYPNLVKGSIVQEAYELVSMNDVTYSVRVNSNIPIVNFKYELILPQDWHILFRHYNYFKDDLVKTRLQNAFKYKYTYTKTNIPAFENEVYSLTPTEANSFIEGKLRNISMFDDPMSDSLITDFNYSSGYSTPKTWKVLSEKLNLYDIRPGSFPLDFDKFCDNLTKNCQTDFERADSIITYIQNNFEIEDRETLSRYWDILQTKKANIFRMTNIAFYMLNRLNIKSYYILCHPSYSGDFDSKYISYSEVPVPAVMFEINNQTYVGFPYIKGINIRKLPDYFVGQKAVIVSKTKNEDRMGEIVTLSSEETIVKRIEDNYIITMNEDSSILVHQSLLVETDYSEDIRDNIKDMKNEEILPYLKKYLSLNILNAEVKNWEIKNKDDKVKPLIIEMNYTIDNVLTILPDEVVFQTSGLLVPISISQYKVDMKERKNPIVVRSDLLYKKSVLINYPENWKFDSQFEPYEMSNKFGKYVFDIKNDNNCLSVTQSTYLKTIKATKEDYKSLVDLLSEKSDLDLSSFVFTVQE